MEKVSVQPNGCWQWQGATNGNGYGRLWDNERGEKEYAHRISHRIFSGPIPYDLEIDHLCRNRGCVNPEHLEAVTRSVNQRRAAPTHCPSGHEYDAGNTYRYRGHRQCRRCRRAHTARSNARVALARRKVVMP